MIDELKFILAVLFPPRSSSIRPAMFNVHDLFNSVIRLESMDLAVDASI